MTLGYLGFRRIFEPFYAPEGDGGGGGGEAGSSNSGESGGGPTFTKEQQDFINALVKREKTDAARKVADQAKEAADQAEAKRKADAEAEAAKARGDFEAVERQLKADLEAAKAEAKAVKERAEKLSEAMKAGVEARWKDLPEKVAKLYKGDAEDPLGKWSFLHDEDVAEIVKDLVGETKTPAERGAGGDPPRGGTGDPKVDEAARAANSMRYG